MNISQYYFIFMSYLSKVNDPNENVSKSFSYFINNEKHRRNVESIVVIVMEFDPGIRGFFQFFFLVFL